MFTFYKPTKFRVLTKNIVKTSKFFLLSIIPYKIFVSDVGIKTNMQQQLEDINSQLSVTRSNSVIRQLEDIKSNLRLIKSNNIIKTFRATNYT